MSEILPDAWAPSTREEFARLKHQLLQNERIWSGFRQIEVRMIGSRSLRELVAILTRELRRTFPKVERVTLACLDPEYELSRLIAQEPEPELAPGRFVAIGHDPLAALFASPWKPRLGLCDRAMQQLLFPHHGEQIGSAALAPLVLQGELIGSLNQGSRDPSHFTADTATDLLEHLAAVTAMCIDNAVSRERLKLDGLTDPLTGVANRRFFERRLAEEVERWARRREPLSCILADIDHFKRINDRFGHQVGDDILKQVAGLLGKDLRAADVLARFGGEEFVLLLPGTAEPQAAAIAERLRQGIARADYGERAGDSLQVTISMGLACLDRGHSPQEKPRSDWLLHEADTALYQAKQAGRNRVIVARRPPLV